MGGHSPEEIKAETRTYMIVFAALAALTLVTVTISYIPMSSFWHIFLGLLVATVKGGLVAAFFMHLLDEKKTIYSILALTMFFFVVLMSVSMGNYLSRPDVERPGAASVVADDDHGAEEAHVP